MTKSMFSIHRPFYRMLIWLKNHWNWSSTIIFLSESRVEPTPVASLDQSIDQKVVDLETSSDLPVEVDIIGLQSDCIGRRFGLISGLAEALNVTLLFTSRLTATATVTKVVTSGTKPFFISGCTPTPFLYKVCNWTNGYIKFEIICYCSPVPDI